MLNIALIAVDASLIDASENLVASFYATLRYIHEVDAIISVLVNL